MKIAALPVYMHLGTTRLISHIFLHILALIVLKTEQNRATFEMAIRMFGYMFLS